MKTLLKLSIFVTLVLYGGTLAASELSGTWKHDEQPVWVQISNQDDVISGIFLRHDVKPELNGKAFIKQFSLDPKDPSQLKGLVYAARLKEFKAAEITQENVDAFTLTVRVKMGFIKRTVISNWSRSEDVPSE